MRHRKAGKQLSRNTSHRRAMLRNITTSLLKYERIETTDAKAKSVRPIAEKMITLAKRGDLHARRQALAYIQDKAVTHKLFDDLKDRFVDRQGGYVRILKKGIRKGDGAPLSIVQLIPKDEEPKGAKKKPRKRPATKTEAPKAKKGSDVKSDEKQQVETAPDTPDEVGVKESKIDIEPESDDSPETESTDETEDGKENK